MNPSLLISYSLVSSGSSIAAGSSNVKMLPPSGLDPYFTSGASNTYCRWIYNRLWTYKIFQGETPTYETVMDLVESQEMSPDKLQLTVKIRSDAKTDQRPPTAR